MTTIMSHEAPPPNDIDRERIVLGSLIQSPDMLGEVGYLTADDFYFEHHQWIFDSITQGPTSDYRLLADRIERAKLEGMGGAQYIIGLTVDVPHYLDLTEHVRVLKDYTARRALLVYLSDIGAGVMNNPDVQQIMTAADFGLQAIQDGRMTAYDTTQDARTVALSLLDDVLEWQSNPQKVRGLATGLVDLDNRLSGILSRRLYYICARPGMGKSALLADIARRTSLAGRGVLIFALEMTANAMMFRMACQQAKIDGRRAKNGELNADDDARLKKAIDELAHSGILIEDQPGLTIQEMQAITRRHERRRRLDVVIVDTLNLVRSSGNTPYERMTAASRAAKDWAHGSSYALICAAQLSRINQRSSDKAPTVDALRDSGALEEDADVILGLHRQGAYDWEKPELEHQAEVLILKNREGEAFKKIKLYWDAGWPGFENAAVVAHDLDAELNRKPVMGRDTD